MWIQNSIRLRNILLSSNKIHGRWTPSTSILDYFTAFFIAHDWKAIYNGNLILMKRMGYLPLPYGKELV